MDTATFLKRIIPDTGYVFLGKLWTPPDAVKATTIYTPFDVSDIDDIVDCALAESSNGETIYYTMGSYAEVNYAGKKNPETKWWGKVGRTQENVKAVKAFWLDLDVKKPKSICYDSQREAAADVETMCKVVGLPLPMLVSSGKGLHCYWPLTKSVDPKAWQIVANGLASVCDHLGVKHDSSCTSDHSRVLRPIGVMNQSAGRPVRLIKDCADISPGSFAKPISAYIKANGIKTKSAPKKPAVSGPNSALVAEVEYPDSYASVLVEHCKAIRAFRDVLGDVGEPYWYNVIGVLKHTVEGSTVCHEWSSGDASYDEDVCQSKIDQWRALPTTCAKMRAVSEGNCEGCTHTCTSPIQLGHVVSTASLPPAPPPVTNSQQQQLVPMPAGFRWNGRSLIAEVPDKSGVIVDHAFCDTLFYPIGRIRAEDGTWLLRCTMYTGHYWRQFDLPQMLIPDLRGLAKHLAQYEVIVYDQKRAMDYTRTYHLSLMQQQREVITYDRFGWDEGSFVVGKTKFLPNGTTAGVHVTTNVQNVNKAIDCAPRGNLEDWVRLVDQAYNRPGGEMFQFAVAISFASPLIALANFDNFRGVPVIYSGEGGIGKSSVALVAASVYASPRMSLINGSQQGGATLQALLSIASMFNGMPLLFDEITDRDAKEFTPIMYSLSNGVSKIRITTSGKFAETAKPYTGFYFGTSNNSVTDAIYEDERKSVSEAVSARCFEIGGLTKEINAQIFAGTDMKDLLEHQLLPNHHGVAAQVYLPYVSRNRDAIVQKLAALRTKLSNSRNVEATSRERYYIDTIAFAHIAAKIASQLGLIKWDVEAMTKWAIGHLHTLRRDFEDRSVHPDEVASRFFSWLHGRTIITKHFPDGRKVMEMEAVTEVPRNTPVARVALKDKKMFVTLAGLSEWCHEHKQPVDMVRKLLTKTGYIINTTREYIGKGTSIHAGRARVYEINYDKVIGSLHVVVTKAVTNPVTEEEVDVGETPKSD